MPWEAYLALLAWRNQKIRLSDFRRLAAFEGNKTPETLIKIVKCPKTQLFLRQNPLWWKTAESHYRLCRQKNYRITYPGEPSYPKAFLPFDEGPAVLTYMGHLPESSMPSVTLVGSRRITEITQNWMDFFLPKVIQEENLLVVSGGARGTDQKAHSIAVRLKRPTVCFLPSGLNHFYPDSLNHFKSAVLENGGAFVSCFSPHWKMKKFYFSIRNRLMACFSHIVLILQAEIRSGTMLTARHALDCGVTLGVLPGPALSPLWTGNLQLLYDGAFLLRDDRDLKLLVENLKIRGNHTDHV